MTECLLGIGSNLGDRAAQMDAAVAELRKHDEINVTTMSGWEESDPVGGLGLGGDGDQEEHQTYLNGAILVETKLSARELLNELLDIERRLGRVRDQRWGPRSVDLDLLLYGETCIDEPGLTVPHPWMAIRKFVVDPAENVAPNMVHPGIGWDLEKLAENLRENPLVIAVVGLKTEAQMLATQAAVKEAGAEFVQLSELLKSAEVDESAAAKLRLLAPEVSSVVSDPVVTIELVGDVREATSTRVSAAADGSSKGPQTLVFDYWWWEPLLSTNLSCSLDSGDLEEEILPVEQPNLLIELGETSSDATREFHQGPKLTLSPDDLPRLQHDLQAAIQGMR